MKTLACLVCLTALAAPVGADLTGTFNGGDITISGGKQFVEFGPGGTQTLRLLPGKRPAQLISKPDGLDLTATTELLVVLKQNAKTKRQELVRATAKGNVRVTLKDSKGNTLVTAPTLTFDAGDESDTLRATGNVKVDSDDVVGKRTLDLSGTNGVISLRPIRDDKPGDRIRTATLESPVRIAVDQARTDIANAGKYIVTGNRLVLNALTSPRTATITGNIKIVSTGIEQGGTIEGAQSLVLSLDKDNKLTAIEAIGDPVTSTYTPRNRPKPKTDGTSTGGNPPPQ
jgi:lipopolysaccharide assembly outer membrane protein LptD (OstA)